ncbi:hypothetical protein I926_00885 [Pasteurella multocida subsp. multocida OH4807]|nr:hypothetical protein I926_00885 [Pasteurella multocida subsp. multocida OH4807]
MSENELNKIKTGFSTREISSHETLRSHPIIEDEQQDYKRAPQEQKLLEEIENLKSTREMREKYANKAYDFAAYTISFWAFLFLAYFLSPHDKKPLNDTALAIFTTACTINILAAFISIIKGLFPNKN